MTRTDSATQSNQKRSLPVAGQKPVADLDIDAELRAFEAEQRAKLGLDADDHWIEDMANLTFTKSEKSKVTLLIGGLTMAHDYLIEGALKHLGYNVQSMDPPDQDALIAGKEFGNRAQCNPTYFTVGNLVKTLIYLRDQKGMSSEEIIDKFVFLTAGACGPCRFGMYVTEYRKALRDAGFDGFRVMLFQQQGGLEQATGEDSGLEMNPPFFLGIVKAVIAGDVINGMGYRIRPYEVEEGATDRAMERAKQECYGALFEGKSILAALVRSRKHFAEVKVDRSRVKPRVAIIGEFWAMTTEGDGNYKLQRFVEEEGAEADIQFVTAWLLYNVWEVAWDTENRAGLRGVDGTEKGLADLGEFGVFKRRVALAAADRAIRVVFQTFANCVGFTGYHLPNMHEIADIAAPYYNNDLRGGEGHMEVGKLILNVVKSKANMTLSVKPFGCMPSSGVSDGVQSLITEKFPGSIYCAVETSGDGATNFYSRVQMYLFKAKQAARDDVDAALKGTGLTEERIAEFLRANPSYASALHKPPHYAGCTAADLIWEIGDVVNRSRTERALDRVRGVARATQRTLTGVRSADARKAIQIAREGAREVAELAREKGPDIARSAVRAARERAVSAFPGQRDEALPTAAE